MSKVVHICKDFYADCSDPLNWILFKEYPITQEVYDKMSEKNKEQYKVGDTYLKTMEKYYPDLESLIEGIIKYYQKSIVNEKNELEDYIKELKFMYEDLIKEIKKNLKNIK